jgi:seryl-tRNA synthetase
MLDINLFRVEKGHDPERIRESQRKRFARVELVDEIIDLDKKWRERKFFFLLSSSLLEHQSNLASWVGLRPCTLRKFLIAYHV